MGRSAQKSSRVQRVDAVLGGGAFEIGLDFRSRGQVPTPVRVAFETVGIEMRGDVAGQARVGIVAPGAADPIGLFVESDITVALCLQTNAGKNSGHAGAENDDPWLGGGHGCGSSVL